jgi:hypothetical protein
MSLSVLQHARQERFDRPEMGQDVDPECTKSVRITSVYATGGQMTMRIEVLPLDISRLQIENQLP